MEQIAWTFSAREVFYIFCDITSNIYTGFKKWDPATYEWITSPVCLLKDYQIHWDSFYKAIKIKGAYYKIKWGI